MGRGEILLPNNSLACVCGKQRLIVAIHKQKLFAIASGFFYTYSVHTNHVGAADCDSLYNRIILYGAFDVLLGYILGLYLGVACCSGQPSLETGAHEPMEEMSS